MIEGTVYNDTATVLAFLQDIHCGLISLQASGKNKETVQEKKQEKEKEER